MLTRLPSHSSWDSNCNSGHVSRKMFESRREPTRDVSEWEHEAVSIYDSSKDRASPDASGAVEKLRLCRELVKPNDGVRDSLPLRIRSLCAKISDRTN